MGIVYLLVFIRFLLASDSTLSLHILYDLFRISQSRLIFNKR
ncbi:hypothetical protein LINGRAHAP2_LOCUS8821 [Linum grandiflorum]